MSQSSETTAPDNASWHDLAQLASQRAGRPIPFRSIDDTEAHGRLAAAGLPAHVIPVAVGFYAAYRAGWSGTPTDDLERLAGRPATPALRAITAVLDGAAK